MRQADNRPLISFVVAMTPDRVIGRDNQLPWHIPADLAHFKRLTIGKPVVMGRRTFKSIGRPLPQRHNIVVTRDRSYMAEGCTIAHSVEGALSAAGKVSKIAIIGGAQISRSCCRGPTSCTSPMFTPRSTATRSFRH